METIRDGLGNRLVYFDGGMGTLLQQKGLKGGEAPERWNLLYPERVKEVHLAYLSAGADIVTANTFGATQAHLGEDFEKCLRAGIRLAKEAVREAGHGAVAADMSSLGRLLAPYGDMPLEEAIGQFRAAAQASLDAGADLILMETMTDLLEVKAAVIGVKEAMDAVGRKAPLLCSLTFQENGRLLTGADIRGTVAMLCGLRVDALGLNCGHEPEALMGNVKELLRWSPLPVFVSPNASLPVVENGVVRFPTTPEAFAKGMSAIADLGAWGLGGCCGTTPEHIAAMVQATKGRKPVMPKAEGATLLSGRSVSVCLGEKPLLIGERINPTGKPRMKQALRENDLDFLLREAIAQTDAGAGALDVNVGLPEINEPQLLKAATQAIQTVCELPLQLDTADPMALEAALRVYVGKPLINSVCGKQQVMDSVFPLAARYGGVLVALTLDENGIPDTVEGRVAIAKRIVAEAAKYGISQTELLFDALTMTVSTNEQAARVTLETIRRLKEELGLYTVLGVSNVSFGLPKRPLLTAAFTAMAVGNGLSAAILNPMEETVRAAWDAAVAVSGQDAGFAGYLAKYGQAGTEGAIQDSRPLGEKQEVGEASAIVRGLAKEAAECAQQLLQSGKPPLAVIETFIMPALGLVGERYEKGTLFLPQLLQSATAAQAAFEVIRAKLPEKEALPNRRVVLATVRGDVHDIGKNIVKVLLQNYGFAVTDLGRDVPPESVLAAVRETGARLVGLSALMTTTVPAMAETVRLLKQEAPQVRIMVGGAVLTESYARQIGADGYGKDAMAAVRLSQRWAEA